MIEQLKKVTIAQDSKIIKPIDDRLPLSLQLLQFKEQMEDMLEQNLNVNYFPSLNLINSMRYSSLQGGKKLRSFILYFLGRKLNLNLDICMRIGVALEFIHTYTLIHDDLPAIDNDDMRRFRPSNHKMFDEATAILAGDALQSEAFYLLSCKGMGLPAKLQLEILNVVATTIGARNLISGQDFDILFKQSSDVEANILKITQINLLKTAKMIALPFIIAAKLAKKPKSFEDLLASYGEKLGLIFQIRDDFADKEDDKNHKKYLNKVKGKNCSIIIYKAAIMALFF
ncbi:IspA superfamily polyprenyl synthetase protein [Candidatus Hepatincolaceae symbiont of Richtersius coronifer]